LAGAGEFETRTQASDVFVAVRSFAGAVSGINIIAQSPAAVARSKYQAGASALPVTSVSQATTS
jgi:hypothetical protein